MLTVKGLMGRFDFLFLFSQLGREEARRRRMKRTGWVNWQIDVETSIIGNCTHSLDWTDHDASPVKYLHPMILEY